MSSPRIWQTEHDQLMVAFPGESSVGDAAARFDKANPVVFQTLLRLCRWWRQKHPNYPCGIGMLWERMRWEVPMSTSGEPLKLNNNYRAYYARKLNAEPGLEGMFHTRRLRS